MYVLWICYQSELRLLKSLILLRCRRPVIILALCNRVFNNSQLPTDYCHLYALLPPSVSLWAGSNVLFSPYSPFSRHSGLLYYQQPPRGKSYWNLLFPSFSLSFCSKAAWGQGRMAFPDQLTSTRPALHTSAFTVAFFGDYACGALRALWWLCTSEGVKSSWMSLIVVFYTDWQQTLKEWDIQ